MGNITIQTVISIVAAFISLITVIVSIYYNHKSNTQYLKSLDPLLSFKLLELKNEIYLRITNTGKSAANCISIEIVKIENNGDRNELDLDALFDNKFELYPEESTQGRIALWGESMCAKAFPKIYIDVHYEKSITKKLAHIERTVIFSPSYDNKIYGDFNIDLRELNKNVDVMAKANLRTANYLDGCQVAPFDELNILAHRSLHDDLKAVKEGEKATTIMERSEVIKNRM
jgi:hypothetical protein